MPLVDHFVDQRGLAVIDVRDNGDVAYFLHLYVFKGAKVRKNRGIDYFCSGVLMKNMDRIIEIERTHGGTSKVVMTDVESGLREWLPARRVIVITDSNVHRRYMGVIDRYERIVIGMGETNKTLITIEKIYRQLLELRVDRECFLLGFGGGIVTDITGFVAATFMRGVRFGFVSSTLLGQIDASIGGKNGVNVDGYKNMVGTFSQPDFVICDPALLKTLPEREFRAGLAEMIKAGIIADPQLFGMFETHGADVLKTDPELLSAAIERAINVKAAIVERDEREAGERRKLNLGHTFAHAIEAVSDSFNHGEAVAAGICMAVEIAVKMGVLSAGDAMRIRNVIASAGLPTETEIEKNRLMKALRHDKKIDGDSIYLVLPTGIGSCEVKKMPIEELEGLI